MGIMDNVRHAWSMFAKKPNEPSLVETDKKYQQTFEPRALNPNNTIPQRTYKRSSIASMIFNRIAMDASMVTYQHVKIVNDGVDDSTANQVVQQSSLQRLFEVEANIDQTSTDFFHDLVFSLFDEGVVAVVPMTADVDPSMSDSYNISSMRVGKVLEWYPTRIRVRVYNENKGDFSEIIVPKKMVAIIENPLNSILGNENPTMDRLIQKLSILDKQDLELVSNRLNMILQLPYPTRADVHKDQAENRIKDIEAQLKDSNLGIAYISSEEKITQLTRQISSTLMEEIKYLTEELLNQIGLTKNVFNGTASASEMQNYYTRTIEPITKRIQEEFQRKYITKTGYTQGHRIVTYTDPFKLVPTEQLATIGDTLLRNSILTPNEFRAIIGYGPSSNPLANELYNRNIADSNQGYSLPGSAESPEGDYAETEEGYYPPEEQ